jgi:hypothetical protein
MDEGTVDEDMDGVSNIQEKTARGAIGDATGQGKGHEGHGRERGE